MCPSDDEYCSEDGDSDALDSDVEALLYSQIHYAADAGTHTGNQRREVTEVLEKSPEKVVDESESRSDDVEVVVLDEIVSDSDADSEEVVITSDDDSDLIVFSDGDQDIAINVNGVPDSRTEESLWRIDAKDKYRDVQGFRYHNTNNFHCKSCGKMGHLSKNCPQPKEAVCYLCALPGHRGASCPSRMCTRCFMEGHVAFECVQPYVEHCDICNLMGHPSKLCPDFWRRYHLTTKEGPIVTPMPWETPRRGPFCFNCAAEGHFGHRCPCRRRGFFTTPFIISYAIPKWDESAGQEYGPPRKKLRPSEKQPKKEKKRKAAAEKSHEERRCEKKKKKKKARWAVRNGGAQTRLEKFRGTSGYGPDKIAEDAAEAPTKKRSRKRGRRGKAGRNADVAHKGTSWNGRMTNPTVPKMKAAS